MQYGYKDTIVACFPKGLIEGWIEISEQEYSEYLAGNMYLQNGVLVKIDDSELLSKAQANKHSELKSIMQAKRQSLKVDYDDDQFDANETAQANMNTLLQAFNLGATSVSIRSVNEVTHTFNQAHCNELALLMADAVNKLYGEYWQYKDALAKCETVDAVNEIKWE